MIDAEAWDALAPMLAVKHNIEVHTAYRATAIMLPLSLAPKATEVYGLPVVRGDRVALMYEGKAQ